MDIDLTSVLIVAVFSAFFMVPIILFETSKKSKTKRIKAIFNEIALKNEVILDQFDIWQDQFAIGIDSNSNRVLFLDNSNDQVNTKLINLSDFRDCRVVKAEEVIKLPSDVRKITRKIELQLTPNSPTKSTDKIVFFNEESGYSIKDELNLSDKWSRIINTKLIIK